MSRVGILCACEKEVIPYITNLKNKNTTEYAMHTLHLCEIAKKAALQADWKIHFGLATTGDIFTDDVNPDALCIDMETAAVAHTCYMCKTPFIAIRSISDNNVDQGQEAIRQNFDKAAYQSYLL